MLATKTKAKKFNGETGIKVLFIKCLKDFASHISDTGTVTGTKILDVSLNLEIILILVTQHCKLTEKKHIYLSKKGIVLKYNRALLKTPWADATVLAYPCLYAVAGLQRNRD